MDEALALGIRPGSFDTYEFQSKIDEITDEENDLSNQIEEGPEEDEYANEDDELTEQTAFTKIIDENGEEFTIRKSTLVWMLTEPSVSISKDRLRRVQVSNK